MKQTLSLFFIFFIFSSAIRAQNSTNKSFKKIQLYPISINHKYGYINNKGKIVIQPQFDDAEYFFEGLAEIKLAGKYGFIDSTGKIVINPIFDDFASPFSEGLAVVKISGKYGFINKKGQIVIQPQFYDAHRFSEGLALVANDEIYLNSWGYIDKTGKFIIKPIYGDGDDFKEGLAPVHFRGKLYSYINKKGEMIIAPQFTTAYPFSEGLAFVAYDKSGDLISTLSASAIWGAIDRNGKFVINPKTISLPFSFSDGLASFGILDQNRIMKIGYMNKKGEIVIQPQFEPSYIGSFKNGLACVKVANKYGFINKKGLIVINPLFDQTESFELDLVPVWIGKKFGYIDKTGKWIWEKRGE